MWRFEGCRVLRFKDLGVQGFGGSGLLAWFIGLRVRDLGFRGLGIWGFKSWGFEEEK